MRPELREEREASLAALQFNRSIMFVLGFSVPIRSREQMQTAGEQSTLFDVRWWTSARAKRSVREQSRILETIKIRFVGAVQ
jgi:hypothetical protein